MFLRNGGLYRGHVIEILPGDHVTIVVEGGDKKRIAWPEVDRVVVAPAPASPASASPTSTEAATPPKDEPSARVQITSPKPVVLYRRPAGSVSWQKVCESPCNQELPVGGTYRVVGNGVAAKEFGLQANGGDNVDVKVEPASTLGMVAGGAITAAGVVIGYAGALVQEDARKADAACYGYNGTRSPYDCGGDQSQESLGTGLALLGGGMMIGGVILFILSFRTDVTPQATKRTGSAPAPTLDAFVRPPTWRSVSSSERAFAAAPATFPLVFQRSF